mmetsp:Transcript_51512/g.154648  ORF Transcript_51512/g.154648 Transcript_51512/m.154648 type:complete len:225 (+) Transcript_51512:1614-2288(+)
MLCPKAEIRKRPLPSLSLPSLAYYRPFMTKRIQPRRRTSGPEPRSSVLDSSINGVCPKREHRMCDVLGLELPVRPKIAASINFNHRPHSPPPRLERRRATAASNFNHSPPRRACTYATPSFSYRTDAYRTCRRISIRSPSELERRSPIYWIRRCLPPIRRPDPPLWLACRGTEVERSSRFSLLRLIRRSSPPLAPPWPPRRHRTMRGVGTSSWRPRPERSIAPP